MHRRIFAVRVLLVGLVAGLYTSTANATWQLDGTPVCGAVNEQSLTKIIADGSGGAIIVWADWRTGNSDIFAQRVNGLGVPQWNPDGVVICNFSGYQSSPAIVSDGAGGAIVAWHDGRGGISYDIYVQRVNAAGAVQWTANGVALSTAANDQAYPAVASDGAGGAIAVWQDFRSGLAWDVYARRVNASGVPQWAADGVALCTAANTQMNLGIASDGAGGAIASWEDYRAGLPDVYAQRVNATGVTQWLANGVAVCAMAGVQANAVLVGDGAGGAIAAWEDTRNGAADIYAQRVNNSGNAQWTINGVVISAATNGQGLPCIASDGAGGAVIAWEDFRSGTTYDIYVRRVTATGSMKWTQDGVPVAVLNQTEYTPSIVTDGAGGAIVVWHDDRDYPLDESDMYAQRIDGFGNPQWNTNGMPLSTASGLQQFPAVASDGAGGAIVCWTDRRAGLDYDIMAQRVESTYGFWGHPEPIIVEVADIPHDEGGKVAVDWTASDRDLPNPRAIDFYSVWRAVDAVPADANVIASGDLSTLSQDGDGPLYFGTPSQYFERVGTQSAHGWPGYSFAASTRSDSVAASAGDLIFMVAAHYLYDGYVAFASNEVSGHSVDNLAPAAPFLLTAQRVGADVQLHWNRAVAPDLRDYAVYRATSSGVTPVPINFLASSDDTLAVDPNAPSSALYYVVTAYDVHANQSAPSNEANVGALTGIGNTPVITSLTVLQNYPNPFNARTDFEIGLPSSSDVSIEVFDVAGHRVSAMETKGVKGWQRVPFAGRDARGRALASGVYFYRVTAAGKSITNKMVIAR